MNIEVEREVLGFTQCDSDRRLADIWKLPAEVSATSEFYHHAWGDLLEREMSCVVYLEDALCRLRGLGNGYCEVRELDWAAAAGSGATYIRVGSVRSGSTNDDGFEFFPLANVLHPGMTQNHAFR